MLEERIRSEAFAALGGGLKPVCRCGGGAYGDVWLATDSVDRSIAVKIVPKVALKDSWRRELDGIRDYCAKVRGGVSHLVSIYHVAEGADFFCYSMEAADNAAPGGAPYEADTLGRRLASGHRLPLAQIHAIMSQALDGLRALHGRGLIHRDIKPDNIIFVDGELKLGDIGCVSLAVPGASLVGTPRYLPPEIVAGTGASDASQDIYALGKVLYSLLTGFDVDRFPSIPPSVLKNRTERDVNSVMLRACETRRELRYASADEFADALESCWKGGARGLARRFCRAFHSAWMRHAALYAAIAAAAVTASALLVFLSPPSGFRARPYASGIVPGSVRTAHVRSPARSYNAPMEPANPLAIDVERDAGLPRVDAASLEDAAIYARTSLDARVVLLSTPDGQCGVMSRARVKWSCGAGEGSAVAMNRKLAREEAFATARDILASTFLSSDADSRERRAFIMRALSGDTSARPLLERLRAIDPIQKVEVFLRGYALDSMVETPCEDGGSSIEVTLLATVETAAMSIMLDDGIVLATDAEGAADKLRAEIVCGCLPLPVSRLVLVTTHSGRRVAIRISADAVTDDSSLSAAEAAEAAAERELARFIADGPRLMKAKASVFRPGFGTGSSWILDACERLRRSPTATIPVGDDASVRARSFIRDGLIYSIHSSTVVADSPGF